MENRRIYQAIGLISLVVVFMAIPAMGSGEQSLEDLIAQEESGIEIPGDLENEPVSKVPGGPGLVTNTIPQDSVLLIPNSSDPEAVFMFDPYDGDSLGVLISDTDRLGTPQCAIKGPDGNIYLPIRSMRTECTCMTPPVHSFILTAIQLMDCTM